MAINDYVTYSYTGAVQTATLKAGITYKFECWGAKGRAGYQIGSTDAGANLAVVIKCDLADDEFAPL